eukprot:scaffold19435_cov50-Phaeocystis_antarctica.AAC.2
MDRSLGLSNSRLRILVEGWRGRRAAVRLVLLFAVAALASLAFASSLACFGLFAVAVAASLLPPLRLLRPLHLLRPLRLRWLLRLLRPLRLGQISLRLGQISHDIGLFGRVVHQQSDHQPLRIWRRDISGRFALAIGRGRRRGLP